MTASAPSNGFQVPSGDPARRTSFPVASTQEPSLTPVCTAVQAHAQVQAAAVRGGRTEAGLKAAQASYTGNLRGLSETVRAGQLLQLVNRPQEVVAALQQLQQAYLNYYTSTNDYNRAQVRLFRAMRFAAQGLACGNSFGGVLP